VREFSDDKDHYFSFFMFFQFILNTYLIFSVIDSLTVIAKTTTKNQYNSLRIRFYKDVFYDK